jgi:hypothetical protein
MEFNKELELVPQRHSVDNGVDDLSTDFNMLSPSERYAVFQSELTGIDMADAVTEGSSLVLVAFSQASQDDGKGTPCMPDFFKVRLEPINSAIGSDNICFSTGITASSDQGNDILDHTIAARSPSSGDELRSVLNTKQVSGLDQTIVARFFQECEEQWYGLQDAESATEEGTVESLLLFEAGDLLMGMFQAYSLSREPVSGGGSNVESTD